MTLSVLAGAVLASVACWYTAVVPPDPFEFSAELEESPTEVLLFMARTGSVPEHADPAGLINSLWDDPSADRRTLSWAASLLGIPLTGPPTPLAVEFGEPGSIPDPAVLMDDPELFDAYLRRLQYARARGEDSDDKDRLFHLVVDAWHALPEGSRALSLEVLGSLGLDITGEIGIDELIAAGKREAARYLAETGGSHIFHVSHDSPPLERVYAAACSPPEAAAELLDDPLWAVRFNAAGSCGPEDLGTLLSDTVPYVVFRAASARQDAGFADGTEKMRELALLEGPVGHMAAAMLGSADSMLLLELMDHCEPGRRAAAQAAWLSDSMEVSEIVEEKWLYDDYWQIPVSWAWHLVDAEDSLRAERVLNAILDRSASLSDPSAAERYVRTLQGRLKGDSTDAADTVDEDWVAYSLPFDPGSEAPSLMMIRTDAGDFVMEMWHETAPLACAGFAYLAAEGFYDGIRFHRVIPGFVAQAGCPEGTGTGGPGYYLPNERSVMHFGRGVVGMADAGLDTAGSQFFIMLDDHGRLDTRYTAFGSVINTCHLDRITVGTEILEVFPLSY